MGLIGGVTENVTSVLFLVSLADYNASIIEDRGKSTFNHQLSIEMRRRGGGG